MLVTTRPADGERIITAESKIYRCGAEGWTPLFSLRVVSYISNDYSLRGIVCALRANKPTKLWSTGRSLIPTQEIIIALIIPRHRYRCTSWAPHARNWCEWIGNTSYFAIPRVPAVLCTHDPIIKRCAWAKLAKQPSRSVSIDLQSELRCSLQSFCRQSALLIVKEGRLCAGFLLVT